MTDMYELNWPISNLSVIVKTNKPKTTYKIELNYTNNVFQIMGWKTFHVLLNEHNNIQEHTKSTGFG